MKLNALDNSIERNHNMMIVKILIPRQVVLLLFQILWLSSASAAVDYRSWLKVLPKSYMGMDLSLEAHTNTFKASILESGFEGENTIENGLPSSRLKVGYYENKSGQLRKDFRFKYMTMDVVSYPGVGSILSTLHDVYRQFNIQSPQLVTIRGKEAFYVDLEKGQIWVAANSDTVVTFDLSIGGSLDTIGDVSENNEEFKVVRTVAEGFPLDVIGKSGKFTSAETQVANQNLATFLSQIKKIKQRYSELNDLVKKKCRRNDNLKLSSSYLTVGESPGEDYNVIRSYVKNEQFRMAAYKSQADQAVQMVQSQVDMITTDPSAACMMLKNEN